MAHDKDPGKDGGETSAPAPVSGTTAASGGSAGSAAAGDVHPEDSNGPAQKPRSRRGFASMDSEAVRRIASLGGRAAHRSGNAHQFNSEEARSAGAKSRGRRKPEPE